MSTPALLRDPEDRKDLIGGITARPFEVLAALLALGTLYDTGGRDFLSSDFGVSRVLGNNNSRCPDVGSLTALSVKRRLIAGTATEETCDWAADAPSVALPVSGKEAGRFDPEGDWSEVVAE
jgi:hypothetical protein